MKIKILFSILFCLLAFGLSAQIPATPVPAVAAVPEWPTTTIEFEETEFGFGTVEQGARVTQVFTFTNTGEIPLVISAAKGSCGCTVPQWPQSPVLPGETASITVDFDTKGKMGRQNKKVSISANTHPQQSFLYMMGQVIAADAPSSENREAEKEDLLIQPECFVIAPNPTAEILTLEMDENGVGKAATISILSVSGQLMAQRHIPEVPEAIEFEVSHYPSGMYIAKVLTDEGKVGSQCFVVSH